MITLPAGTYYIGDPCYVVEDKDWIKLLESTDYLSQGEFTYKKQLCYADGTAYGDGCYSDNLGNAYGVDAGLLSIMPMKAVKSRKDVRKLGSVIEFDTEFEVDSNNGIFHFGHITINTRDEEAED